MLISFIKEQFKVFVDDFVIKVVKIGMLVNDDVINVVVDFYDEVKFGLLVVDLVIIIKYGVMFLE